MKKILTTISILIFSVFVFGQDSQSVSTWQEFSPDGEEFSVELPRKVIESTFIKGRRGFRDSSTDLNNIVSGDYRTYSNEVFYFMFSKMLPFEKNSSIKGNLDQTLNSFISEFDKEAENINFDNLTGTKYEFVDSEDFYHNIILVDTKKRSYRFHVISENKKNLDVNRFINSIKFNETIKPFSPNKESYIYNLNNPVRFNFSEGENPKNDLNVDSQELSPMKITHKPRANYTDLARSYRLNGTVTFKATFSADGKIENLIPLKKMPFGLTDSVIEAIKGIKFEPEIKNGVPQSTTRMLNYSFEIF